MAAASPTDTRLDDFTASIPDPGTTTTEHLEHTLACFSDVSAGHVLLRGDGATFTVGHLRALGEDRQDRVALHALLSVLVANRGKAGDTVAITATDGVYNVGRTGLTWADLLELGL